jgi:hypothetical protein
VLTSADEPEMSLNSTVVVPLIPGQSPRGSTMVLPSTDPPRTETRSSRLASLGARDNEIVNAPGRTVRSAREAASWHVGRLCHSRCQAAVGKLGRVEAMGYAAHLPGCLLQRTSGLLHVATQLQRGFDGGQSG